MLSFVPILPQLRKQETCLNLPPPTVWYFRRNYLRFRLGRNRQNQETPEYLGSSIDLHRSPSSEALIPSMFMGICFILLSRPYRFDELDHRGEQERGEVAWGESAGFCDEPPKSRDRIKGSGPEPSRVSRGKYGSTTIGYHPSG